MNKKKKIFGTKDRPRLRIFQSNRHFYAQIIDDEKGHTLAAADTRRYKGKRRDVLSDLASDLKKQASKKNIVLVVLDLYTYRYQGLAKQFAEEIKKVGLSS